MAHQVKPKQESQLLLRQQIERILDTTESNNVDVIVKMRSKDESRQLVNFAAEQIQQRNLTLNARDVLPREKFSNASTEVNSVLSDLESFINLSTQTQIKRIKSDTQSDLDTLWKSVSARQEQRRFWTSRSIRLELTRDELGKLVKADDLIKDIYLNRVLSLPRVMESRNLPQGVMDLRACAWGIHRINAVSAWGAYGVRGAGVTIGVLDTGVEEDHPDLTGKINGWAEFDASGKKLRSKSHDNDKHGTHCAGTIVGGNASGKWIGVAPDAKIKVAKVLGQTGGTDAQILAGIDWLVDQKVDVISMSLGGLTLDNETPNTYTEAILTCLQAGIPVVTAIGNEGEQTTGSPGNDLFAFAVGATDFDDRAAGFSGGRTHIIRRSNFIPPESLPLPYSKPEVSAPGVAIYSSVPDGKWMTLNGTSMATPHVAGALALLLSATNIRDTVPVEGRAFLLQQLISGTVDELGESGQDHRFGFGRIDVLRAIDYAKSLGY